ncbi:hypothetical protein KVT40_003041 [Elsinoe batatas]|uniref:Methyltransferase type 11 domain-containing protein n=1 Tax=Elsinoe batatas TaxID=2601811 RepID=A0A8K0PGP1_9PEZI|nr:hypothetical protein KVT40_003041 [Elsinoe batatas]
MTSEKLQILHKTNAIRALYDSFESRLGYKLIMREARHFGCYKDEYQRAHPLHSHLREMEDVLLQELDLPEGSKVLDVGCGAGRVAVRMAKHGLFKARTFAVANGVQSRVNVHDCDYRDLRGNFANDSMDGIYSMETLVHATDLQTMFREFFRVLKPGGHVAFHEYNHVGKENAVDHVDRYISLRRKYFFIRQGKLDKPARAQAASDLVELGENFNKDAAMFAGEMWGPGVMRRMLEQAGFVDVVIQDMSKNIRPNVRLFFQLAYVLFLVLSTLRIEGRFTNACGAMYGWWGQDLWQYVAVTATKPFDGTTRS